MRSKTERAAWERGQDFVESWSKSPPLTAYGGALPKGEPFGTPRRRPLRGKINSVRRREFVRTWFARILLHPLRGSPLPEGAFGTPRRRPLQGEMEFVRGGKLPRRTHYEDIIKRRKLMKKETLPT